MKYCEVEGGHLPSSTELAKIAQVLYDNTSITGDKAGLTQKNKTAVQAALNINNNEYLLWGNTSNSPDKAFRRHYMITMTSTYYVSRNNEFIFAVCIGD